MSDDLVIGSVVLAGGQSSRMGQDKALLEINGKPLLQQVCEVAAQCTKQVYIVTCWRDRYQSLAWTSSYQFVIETDPQGPLLGFALGLSQLDVAIRKNHTRDGWVLLLACDLPNLKAEILQTWQQQLQKVPREAIAFLPHHPKGWEPLCGFYRLSCLENLTEFIHQGGRSFQAWLAQSQIEPIINTDPQMLFNCNTMADLATAISDRNFS